MMFLLRLLSKLPLVVLHALGTLGGWLSWSLSPSYRARCAANAGLAGLSAADRRAAVGHAGRMIAELPWLWLRPVSRPLGSRVRWEGAELIEQALQASHGLVFMTPHMGCFEVTAQAYAERFAPQGCPVTVLYRPARKPWMREVVEQSRGRPGLATAPASLSGVRQMIRALRRGEAVGLLPDQVPPQGLGVWADFFGQPAYTMTLGARLLQQTGAASLAIFGERLSWGRGFVIHVRPGPDIPADSTPECAAALINKAMEAVILQQPSQYLWGYNRYKAPRPQEAEA
ncbi:lysophospholipid acyltransferase family protein [Paucibacter sp. APW11]|uniref:Lysophospholipid acyltransferase family protein n=1 Tax=Roseateles aquae TaxID=3077235 RepID=A0ABU3PAR6_9BURK|nr:lysophospholipid acyltransferase family protein [Paucibacter sp. APW11]MDT8999676.1 lysophospholipid acyltransferase family protein [Paucibacter sp. APW11]